MSKNALLGELFSRAGSLSEEKLEELLAAANKAEREDEGGPKSISVTKGIRLQRNSTSPFWWASITSEITGVNQAYRESTQVPLSNIEGAKAKAHQIAAKARTLAENGQLKVQQAHSTFQICQDVKTELRILADKNNESQKKVHAGFIEKFFYPFCKEQKIYNIHQIKTSTLHTYFHHLNQIEQLRSLTGFRNHSKAVKYIFEYALRSDYIKKRDTPELPSPTSLNINFAKLKAQKLESGDGHENNPFEHYDYLAISSNLYKFLEDSGSRAKETTLYYRNILPLYFEFLIAQGCRPGEETLGLKFENIARQYVGEGKPPVMTIAFRKGKMGSQGKGRTVELTDDALSVILRICKLRFERTFTLNDLREMKGFIFYDEYTQKKPPLDRVWKQYIDWLQKEELLQNRYNLYSCRHEFINKMLDTRAMTIEEIAGHCGNSVQTIQQYYQKYCVVRKKQRQKY